ncbi:MAG: hypothetical protein EZS28_049775, partial [Streblomastix strix]
GFLYVNRPYWSHNGISQQRGEIRREGGNQLLSSSPQETGVVDYCFPICLFDNLDEDLMGQFRITYFQIKGLQLYVQRVQIDLKMNDSGHVPNFFILYYYYGVKLVLFMQQQSSGARVRISNIPNLDDAKQVTAIAEQYGTIR